ncbi:hypothetical protein GCM10007164_27600 [Luteimonas padinae]|uniref:Uncharacterized protein n=1 Tax=Luteimonas padinae TaxID=1714359 RepID=A0ABV6SUQ2_9GAMM|nr:hypothetical protein [Luteimonas padinae]GHD75508.1 hypothetical protein GCM10007164_27600 [Luteimonas padinae]
MSDNVESQSELNQVGGAIDSPELRLVVRSYLESLRNITETAKIVLPHLAEWLQTEVQKVDEVVRKYAPEGKAGDEIVFDNAREFVEFSGALQRWDRLQSDKSLPLLSRSLFMQIFCEFDAFIGRLLKAIYLKSDSLLRGISREISLVELLEFDSVEAASKSMLEREVDSFRRDSYIEQFGQLERKFGIPLKKFAEWPEFVEFGQRRNFFAHNDGVVTDHYLSVCKREGGDVSSLVPGERLSVSPAYLARALLVMSKLGYMLCHTLWSKVFPGEVSEVHDSLNSILYESLEDKRWRFAVGLSEFALSDQMRKGVSEVDLRLRIINSAIARKFSGDDAETVRLLRSVDWTASYRDFKLAILILEDKFDEAISLLRDIGRRGELLHQEAYHSWPLFERFREREDFYSIYEEIYGEPYEADSNELSARLIAENKHEKARLPASANAAESAKLKKGSSARKTTVGGVVSLKKASKKSAKERRVTVDAGQASAASQRKRGKSD